MYIKPIIIKDAGFAEGVYMASGSTTNCWTVSEDANAAQAWNGSHHVYQIRAIHSTDVKHISGSVTFTFTMSGPVVDAYSEWGPAGISGNQVTVTRDLHANAYNSGDAVTFKIWVQSADEASTRGLQITNFAYQCVHQENVQGGLD